MHIVVSNSARYHLLLFRALLKKPKLGALAQSSSNARLSNPSFTINVDVLSRYCEHFGFDKSSVPVTYLFVATQSELLQLFVHPDTPVRPLGLVHTFVEFEQFEDLEVGQRYQFTVVLEMKEQTERGQRFETLGEFSRNGKVVARYRSGYLMPVKNEKPQHRRSSSLEDITSFKPQIQLQTSKFSTRAYAKVSGDYNPIHLSGIAAKLFGFKAPIAHGMDMAARLLAIATNQADSNLNCSHCRFDFQRPVFISQTLDVVNQDSEILLRNENGKRCVTMATLNSLSLA